MDRSFGIAVGRRLSVAMLLVLSVSVPAGSRAAWDVSSGPSRLSETGRIPGSPVSLRPTDGNADPEGHGYSVPSRFVCGAHVCVHWVIATSDAPPLTDTNHNQVPDQVDRTLSAFETAWRVEVIRMGFREPMSDASSADHGPNDKLDVYLADVGASGLGGYVATDDPNANDDAYRYRNYSTYIVVDDDFSTSQLGASGGPGGLRATAAHEFFHAVQYAYDSSEDPWLTEGTAVWMEDEVADDVNANRRWLRSSPLVHPWVPIDSSRGLNEYGAWIFWRFLTESGPDSHVDPPRVGARRRRTRRSESVLRPSPRAGTRLDRSLAGRCARHVRRLEPGTCRVLRRGRGVSARAGLRASSRQRRPPDGGLVDVVAQPSVDRFGLVRARIDRQLVVATSRSTVRREGRVRPRGSSIFLRSGFLRLVPVTLDAEGDADITVPFSSGQVSRVVLVVANASTDFRCWTGAGYSCNGRSRADGMPFRYLATLVH